MYFHSQTSTVAGTIQSQTASSQDSSMYDVTWVSSKTLTVDGQYSYSIIVTTVTNSDPVIGTFTIGMSKDVLWRTLLLHVLK